MSSFGYSLRALRLGERTGFVAAGDRAEFFAPFMPCEGLSRGRRQVNHAGGSTRSVACGREFAGVEGVPSSNRGQDDRDTSTAACFVGFAPGLRL